MTRQPQAKYRHDYHASDYWITDTDLTFDLDAEKTVVTIVSQAVRHGAFDVPLRLNGRDLTLVSIRVNNEPWAEYKEEESALVTSQLPERSTLRIASEISSVADTALKRLYKSDDALCTQCEAEGSRHTIQYLNGPDVLARFITKITADGTQYLLLLSNSNRVAQGKLGNGRHWVQQQGPLPKPCYLFVLVAGDFDVLCDTFATRSGREVALELYVDRDNLDRVPWAMTSLKSSVRWDEERSGLEYDFDIHMTVAVDFFNMGAMENKGPNTFNSKYVLACTDTATDKDCPDIGRIIGHEYSHNWIGNRVTCRDRFQLNLKEDSTVFHDQESSSDLGSRAVNRISNVRTMHDLQLAEGTGPVVRPIRLGMIIEVNNFYTLTVYEKGAEVIRMIHILLDEVSFQKGMQLHFERHDGSAAACDDFVQAMEDASNANLSHFRCWYSQSGTPILTVRDDYNPSTEQYTLTVSQHTPATPDQAKKQPLHIPFAPELYDNEGKVIPLQKDGHPANFVLDVTQAEQMFVLDSVYFQPVSTLLCEFSVPTESEYK